MLHAWHLLSRRWILASSHASQDLQVCKDVGLHEVSLPRSDPGWWDGGSLLQCSVPVICHCMSRTPLVWPWAYLLYPPPLLLLNLLRFLHTLPCSSMVYLQGYMIEDLSTFYMVIRLRSLLPDLQIYVKTTSMLILGPSALFSLWPLYSLCFRGAASTEDVHCSSFCRCTCYEACCTDYC